MLAEVVDPLGGLEMIDDLQRLGVCYHFEDEIKRVLDNIRNDDKWNNEDLHSTALQFRLLRQHGYNHGSKCAVSGSVTVSIAEFGIGSINRYVSGIRCRGEVFNSFRDKFGNFKKSLCEDTKGLLSLYEASYLLMEDESILEEARDFTTKHLKEWLKMESIDPNLGMLVSHALELPLHWAMPRMEARWFIDAYEGRLDMNAKLLELAKLDFNMLQAIHQEDLKHASRWWESTGWGKKLPFVRDRVVENYLWSLGEAFEPKFQNFRSMETRINILATCVDDVYDAYGTLDELQLFTTAIDSTNAITNEELECIEKCDDIIKWSSMVARLADDLGTSWDEVKQGVIPKSIQIYMHETGVSTEDAKEHINYLISEAWKKINEARVVDSSINGTFVEIVTNMARVFQFMYQYGDGHGHDIGGKNKERVTFVNTSTFKFLKELVCLDRNPALTPKPGTRFESRLLPQGVNNSNSKFLKELVCLDRNPALTPKPGTQFESRLLLQVSHAKAVQTKGRTRDSTEADEAADSEEEEKVVVTVDVDIWCCRSRGRGRGKSREPMEEEQ
ncbi:hypothetical protein TEA_012692 [Camellia sinensis var. sinensis]|uniref:Uncharacterized protein n=1 Tax=Camellia sinensis var. sinensis TaxID=542762 RepID=A0A4S4EAH8_CAMSN|nr:hypothetical protein TEA_012692 [Camellia sinensis var. sinensis]